jgi:hypothetical protein
LLPNCGRAELCDCRARPAAAAAGLEAHVHAVAVEVLALAGEPDERVAELLVVLAPVENSSLITTSPVGQDTVAQHFDARSVSGSSSIALSVSSRQVARSAARAPRSPPSSLGDQLPGLLDPRERGVDRGRRLAHAGQDLAARTRASAGTRR